MRLLVLDNDDLAVTPADLSDLAFEGSPARLGLTVRGEDPVAAVPFRESELERPTGSTSGDEWYDLSALLRPPCEAEVEWDGGIATLRVVRRHYCRIDDVLDFGDEKRQSPRRLGRTEADAFRARNDAEAVCDDLCRDAFRETWHEEPYLGIGRQQLDWPTRRLLTDGFRLVGDGEAVREGAAPWLRRDPESIAYVYGSDRRVPPDVARAVAKLAASYLTVSKVPDRAVYESTEAGMTRYTLAGEGSTGIPDVDAVFSRHARRRWAVL